MRSQSRPHPQGKRLLVWCLLAPCSRPRRELELIAPVRLIDSPQESGLKQQRGSSALDGRLWLGDAAGSGMPRTPAAPAMADRPWQRGRSRRFLRIAWSERSFATALSRAARLTAASAMHRCECNAISDSRNYSVIGSSYRTEVGSNRIRRW
jgi:hypothetical protein